MKVEFIYHDTDSGSVIHAVKITREPNDKPIYKESTLWHHLRKTLNSQGHNYVRQVPSKDGHLTSMPYYLKPGRGSEDKIIIGDDNYAIDNPAKTYRENGHITFQCYPVEA